MRILDRARPELLFLACLSLTACADSARSIPFGAKIDPMNVGIDQSIERDGSNRIYVWQVHEFDGTTHILTWKDATGNAGEVLRDFDSCRRDRCQTTGEYRCPLNATAGERPHAPQLFPTLLTCAASANMSGYQETTGPRATEYRVLIVTGDAASYMAAGEIPLGPKLGGKRIVVSHAETDKTTVVADVDGCLRVAAKQGLFESCGIGNHWCKTVEPMLGRFDECLRSRSYTVEPCSENCSAPSAKERQK